MIKPAINAVQAALLRQLPMLLVTAHDGDGQAWASALVGPPGFVSVASDPSVLTISAARLLGDGECARARGFVLPRARAAHAATSLMPGPRALLCDAATPVCPGPGCPRRRHAGATPRPASGLPGHPVQQPAACARKWHAEKRGAWRWGAAAASRPGAAGLQQLPQVHPGGAPGCPGLPLGWLGRCDRACCTAGCAATLTRSVGNAGKRNNAALAVCWHDGEPTLAPASRQLCLAV